MSNERRHRDDSGDPRVSSVYREFSDERTPEHLDHVVLNEARRAAKPGYVRKIAWLRPAAWVTTIGLCLAIVLEVTDMVPPEPSALPAEAEQEPEASEEPVVTAPATGWTPVSAPEAKGPVQAEAAPAATPQPTDAGRRGPPVAEALDQDDGQLLRDAEELTRTQTGADQDPVDSPRQASPIIGLHLLPDSDRFCDEEQSADPNTWLECILNLEQQGLLEAAKIERDLLRESFPDAFVPPMRETTTIPGD